MDIKDSPKTNHEDDGLLIIDDKNENQENSKKAELLFSEYLNSQKIPYYFIDQSKEKYSNEFKENNMQRPDFIIHTKYSIFYIDVKHRKKYYLDKNMEKSFYLNQYELKRLFKFQNELNTTVWIAFIDIENSTKFYFSSISDIYEYYTNVKNNMEKKHQEIYAYFDIPECYIHIPKELIFEHLSFEKGFFKEPDLNYIENETEHYVNKIITILRSKK